MFSILVFVFVFKGHVSLFVLVLNGVIRRVCLVVLFFSMVCFVLCV